MLSGMVLRKVRSLLQIGDNVRTLPCLLLTWSLLLVGCGKQQADDASPDVADAKNTPNDMDDVPDANDKPSVSTDPPNAKGNPGESQAAAVAAISKFFGELTFDEENPGRPLVGVNLRSTRVTDAGLEHLKGLTKLQTLVLFSTKVTAAGVKDLQAVLPKCSILK